MLKCQVLLKPRDLDRDFSLNLSEKCEKRTPFSHFFDPFHENYGIYPFSEWSKKWSKSGRKSSPFSERECLKTRGNRGPGPIPRCTTEVRTMSPIPHHPGYTHHPHMLSRPATPGTRGVSEAQTRSPGFIRLQSQTLNTDLVKTTTFLMSKTGPVKTALFVQNPYLILI